MNDRPRPFTWTETYVLLPLMYLGDKMHISDKWKAVVAALGTVLTALTAAFADDVVDLNETGNIVAIVVAAVVSVYAVWRVPNQPVE